MSARDDARRNARKLKASWARFAASPPFGALLRQARAEWDWETLGYESWEDYLKGEFGEHAEWAAALAEPKRRGAGTVYFIRASGGTGPVKIGYAADVWGRLASLQTGSPVPLCVVATVPGGRALEARLHEQFAQLRSHGEWFHAAPELLEYIASHAEPWTGRSQ